MKILIKENQYKKLLETITNDEEKKFIGKQVMVYRNLHKDTFSIQYKSRVVLYADYVKLNEPVYGANEVEMVNSKNKIFITK